MDWDDIVALDDCCWGIWFLLVLALYFIFDRLLRVPYIWGVKDCCFFITGCDTGFGNEIAKRLDNRGCTVFAGCFTEKGEVELKKECSSCLHVIPLDVTSPESIRKAYDYVKKHLPEGKGLDGVLNNAGVNGRVAPVEWLERGDYDVVFAVNFHGLVDVTMTFLPLIKQQHGRIVNTSSIYGRTTTAIGAIYCSSKYAVEAFSDCLRRHLRDYKCSVHLIEPSFYKTPLNTEENWFSPFEDTYNRLSPEMREEYGEDFVEKKKQEIVKFLDTFVSDRVSDVIDAYEHALLGMFPRARYLVGKGAIFLWIPLQWLPEWLGDWALEKLAGQDRPIPVITKNAKN